MSLTFKVNLIQSCDKTFPRAFHNEDPVSIYIGYSVRVTEGKWYHKLIYYCLDIAAIAALIISMTQAKFDGAVWTVLFLSLSFGSMGGFYFVLIELRTNFVEKQKDAQFQSNKCRVFCVLFVVVASLISIILAIAVMPSEGKLALAVSELCMLIAMTFTFWARNVAGDLRKQVMTVPEAQRGVIDMEGCACC